MKTDPIKHFWALEDKKTGKLAARHSGALPYYWDSPLAADSAARCPHIKNFYPSVGPVEVEVTIKKVADWVAEVEKQTKGPCPRCGGTGDKKPDKPKPSELAQAIRLLYDLTLQREHMSRRGMTYCEHIRNLLTSYRDEQEAAE